MKKEKRKWKRKGEGENMEKFQIKEKDEKKR